MVIHVHGKDELVVQFRVSAPSWKQIRGKPRFLFYPARIALTLAGYFLFPWFLKHLRFIVLVYSYGRLFSAPLALIGPTLLVLSGQTKRKWAERLKREKRKQVDSPLSKRICVKVADCDAKGNSVLWTICTCLFVYRLIYRPILNRPSVFSNFWCSFSRNEFIVERGNGEMWIWFLLFTICLEQLLIDDKREIAWKFFDR